MHGLQILINSFMDTFFKRIRHSRKKEKRPGQIYPVESII